VFVHLERRGLTASFVLQDKTIMNPGPIGAGRQTLISMPTSATICIRPPRGVGGSTVVRNYPTPEAGAKAAQTPKCGAKCAGAHLLLIYDRQGQPHVARLPKPPPPPLAVELSQLFPRVEHGDVWRLPPDPSFNEPLDRSANPSPLRERRTVVEHLATGSAGSGSLAAGGAPGTVAGCKR
jgi:hypothetical protein